MPSFNTLYTMGSAALGGGVAGYLGFNKAKEEGYDANDTTAYTTSSVVAGSALGIGVGAVTKAIGFSGFVAMPGTAIDLAKQASRPLMWNPIRPMLQKMGRKNFGYKAIPHSMRTPLIGLAIMAAGIGAVAYGARSNVKPTTYASPDGNGNVSYNSQSIKERMGMLGATGEMVFGMHNLRHS